MAVVIFFIIGLFIGSFLNCTYYRLSVNEGFKEERSFCPKCKHTLAWYDLIPLLSFLMLKGKCRYCKEKISWQYPLSELATGALFALTINYLGFDFALFDFEFFKTLYFLTVASFFVIIFIFDLKHCIIPDSLMLPLIIIGCLWFFACNNIFSIYSLDQAWNYIYSAFAASYLFLLVFLYSGGRGMGFADVKLAFFMGLFLGWPKILLALFLANLFGAIIGVALIANKKRRMSSEIPFGPFLIVGTYAALFFGDSLINWYLNISF